MKSYTHPVPLALAEQMATHIKAERSRKRLTQAQLAELSGVSQPVIAVLESGRGNPTLASINRACDALGLRLRVQIW